MECIAEVQKLLVGSGTVKRSEFVGCNHAEITQIAARQGFQSLPREYCRFLEVMGKSAGRFLRGSDCFYPDLVKGIIRASLNDELFSQGFGPLRSDAFVFRTDQGVQYYHFVCDSDNPIVRYVWPSRNPHPEVLGIELLISENKFTEFLMKNALLIIEQDKIRSEMK